jgi:DNA-3-methyladenine glycosylase II
MKPTPAELAALARRDPRLGRWMRALAPFPGFPDPSQRRLRTHYDALAHSIFYQQLHENAARSIYARVCALSASGAFPSATELLGLPESKLRGAGLSGNKLAALRDLAACHLDGRLRLRAVARMSDEQVVEHLTQVRGIGAWSAHMFLLFRLGRLDVMAPGDFGVREGLRLLDESELQPTPKAAEARAAAWAPLRSVGCWYMWRLVEHTRASAKASRT